MKSEITFDAFDALELRVGIITDCIKHPDADRLLVFTVDFGESGTRTIVSSLAEFYRPEEVKGLHIVGVLNLKGRKMRGIMSEGMILTAEYTDADGKEHVSFLTSDMPAGTLVC